MNLMNKIPPMENLCPKGSLALLMELSTKMSTHCRQLVGIVDEIVDKLSTTCRRFF